MCIRDRINEALESDNPLTVVPSTDTNGHGTFLAGIAAGGILPNQDFTGAAPECELVIVKLKPAKQYLRDFYLVSSDADAYQENDIMMGIKYLRVEAYSCLLYTSRVRGTHDVDLMSNIVKELHEFGRSDTWISKHLGMDRDEILRLKQITGLAALFRLSLIHI